MTSRSKRFISAAFLGGLVGLIFGVALGGDSWVDVFAVAVVAGVAAVLAYFSAGLAQRGSSNYISLGLGVILLASFALGGIVGVRVPGLIADFQPLKAWEATRAENERDAFRERAMVRVQSFALTRRTEERLSYKGRGYRLAYFDIPGSIDYVDYGLKPQGYLARSGDEFLLITGDGVIFSFHGPETFEESVAMRSVPSNLPKLLPPKALQSSKFSVKGASEASGELYVSIVSETKKAGETCTKTVVLAATLSGSNFLDFSPFWEGPSCLSHKHLNPHAAGGGLAKIRGERLGLGGSDWLMLGYGDYLDRRQAQIGTNEVGSVVAISLDNPAEHQIVATGLRNPQGLAVGTEGIYLTEQGPQGGDELNFIPFSPGQEIKNFGWPIASYGRHYTGSPPDAPLYGDHARFGFQEPLYYWTPSIGISSVSVTGDSVVVGALGWNSAEGDMSLHFLSESSYDPDLFNLDDWLVLDFRVRDLLVSGDHIWAVADSGMLVVISIDD